MTDAVDKFISACLNYIKVKDGDKITAADAVKVAAKSEVVKTIIGDDAGADADALVSKLPDILKNKKYTSADNNIYIKNEGGKYNAINITTGNAWEVNAKDDSATFGGKKTKTHRQKKVHRSTQKRNGRKRTSHRRK